MISALKRALAKGDPSAGGDSAAPPSATGATQGNNLPSQNTGPAATTTAFLNNGMHMISQSLQKKFSRGVHYNSKPHLNLPDQLKEN